MKENKRPLILITNDDGISAEGIHKLADFVSDMGEVIVAAPDGPRSGFSTAITAETPLRMRALPDYNGMRMNTINGTPADCVKLTLNLLARDNRRPDIVISGINHGANTGNSTVYSGTMGAALEGVLQGIPSVGFSLLSHRPAAGDFDAARDYIRRIVKKVLAQGLPDWVCLNVNIPYGMEIKGMTMAKSCIGRWSEEYAEYTDPAERKFYMLTGKYENLEPENKETDLYHLSQGMISIVPVHAFRDYEGNLPDFTV